MVNWIDEYVLGSISNMNKGNYPMDIYNNTMWVSCDQLAGNNVIQDKMPLTDRVFTLIFTTQTSIQKLKRNAVSRVL